jgi:YhcG PDDEXK nuclease domain
MPPSQSTCEPTTRPPAEATCSVILLFGADKVQRPAGANMGPWAEEMEVGENPPIGILLCSEKNETHVEYALGGMSNRIFVSRYLPHVTT